MATPTVSCKSLGLLVLDQILMFTVVASLVVFYWRGTWVILDVYMFTDRRDISAWISFALGTVGMAAVALFKGAFGSLATEEKCSLKWILGCHVYTYVTGALCVNLWRGIWLLLDVYTGVSLVSASVTFVIGFGVLYLLRGSKNAMSPPVASVMDTDQKQVFAFNTRFATKTACSDVYLLDTVLTSFIIHSLVVFVWRGSWELADLLLFPDDLLTSSLWSLAGAAGLFCALVPVQIGLLRLQHRLRDQEVARVLVDDLVFTLGTLVAVFHWRGVWFLCDLGIYTRDLGISAVITHAIGYLGTSVLLSSSSVIVKSFSLDGATLAEHTTTYFPNEYIRYFTSTKESRTTAKDLTNGAPTIETESVFVVEDNTL